MRAVLNDSDISQILSSIWERNITVWAAYSNSSSYLEWMVVIREFPSLARSCSSAAKTNRNAAYCWQCAWMRSNDSSWWLEYTANAQLFALEFGARVPRSNTGIIPGVWASEVGRYTYATWSCDNLPMMMGQLHQCVRELKGSIWAHFRPSMWPSFPIFDERVALVSRSDVFNLFHQHTRPFHQKKEGRYHPRFQLKVESWK